jgi:hypothetical protein
VGEYQNIKNTNRERKDSQETPCALPQDKQEDPCVIANVHNECMRKHRILKSQRQRGIKYPEYREYERESTIKSINVRMFLPDEQPFEEGGGKRCGDTPIQPTTIICSSGWGCLVVLQAISQKMHSEQRNVPCTRRADAAAIVVQMHKTHSERFAHAMHYLIPKIHPERYVPAEHTHRKHWAAICVPMGVCTPPYSHHQHAP